MIMKKYKLTVGYGDYCWDLGFDEFCADTIEELYDEIYTNPISIEKIKQELAEYEYVEDEIDGMWRIEIIGN